MAISYVGTQNTTFSASGTSFSFTTPSGAAAGDLLVATFAYNTPSTTDVSNTKPSGWTEAPPATGGQFDSGSSLGSAHLVVATKAAVGGAETFSWTTGSTVNNGVVSVTAYRGADTTTPWDVNAYTDETISQTHHDTGSINPTTSGSWIHAMWASRNNSAFTSVDVAVPPLTVRVTQSANGGSSGTSGIRLYGGDTNGGTVTSGGTYFYTANEPSGTSAVPDFIGAIRQDAGGPASATLTSVSSITAPGANKVVATATLSSVSAMPINNFRILRSASPPVVRGMNYGISHTGTSNVLTFPAGTKAGDFAFVDASSDVGTVSAPGGWTLDFDYTDGIIYTKTLTSTDITTGSVTMTTATASNQEATIITFQAGSVYYETGGVITSGSTSSIVFFPTQGLANAVTFFKTFLLGVGNTVSRSLTYTGSQHVGTDPAFTLDFGYLTKTTAVSDANTLTITGTNTHARSVWWEFWSGLSVLAGATLTSASSLTAAATTASPTQATLTSVSSLTAAATTTAPAAAANLVSGVTITAVGTPVRLGVAALSSASSITAAPAPLLRSGVAALASASSLTAGATNIDVTTPALSTAAAIVLTPVVVTPGAASLGSISSLTAAYGTVIGSGAILLASASSMTTGGTRIVLGTGNAMTSASSMTSTSVVTTSSSSAMTNAITLTSAGARLAVGVVTLSTGSTITVVYTSAIGGTATLKSNSTITVGGTTPPRVVSHSEYHLDTPSTPVSAPSGLTAGDLVLALQFQDYAGSLSSMGAPDASWTQAYTNSNAVGFAKIWWKIATNSEPATYQFTGTSAADTHLVLLRVNGANNNTPFLVAPSWGGSTGATTTHTAPTVSPGIPSGLMISAWAIINQITNFTWTPPSGFTADSPTAAVAGWVTALIAHKPLSASGATGTQAATSSISAVAPYGDMVMSMVLAPAAPVVSTNVTLGSASTMVVQGAPVRNGVSVMTSASAMTTAGVVFPIGSASLFSVSSLTGVGFVSQVASATMSSAATITVPGVRVVTGAISTLENSASLTVAGTIVQVTSATLSSQAVVTAVGELPTRLQTSSGLTVISNVLVLGDPEALNTASYLIAAPSNQAFGVATLSSASAMSSAGLNINLGTATLSTYTLVRGFFIAAGAAKLSSNASMTTRGVVGKPAAATLSSVSKITAPGVVTRKGVATISTASSLTAAGVRARTGQAALITGSSLTCAGLVYPVARAVLRSVPSITTAATDKSFGVVTMSSGSLMTAAPKVLTAGISTMTSATSLTSTAIVLGPNSVVRGWGVRL